ncbi:MAG: CPBP family intramembrane metalloprotease [Bacteroides sp.]|nr:CPBP family intramembrane metalloprotease [Bacteroides sp.]
MSLNFTPEDHQRALMMKRLFILFATMVIGLLIVGVLTMILGTGTTKMLRLSTLFQDIFMFILPAVATAMLSSRLPANFLCISKGFTLQALLVAVLLMIVSVPFQNAVIHWNETLSLPESMASVEAWMKAAEERAQQNIGVLMGGTSVPDLIVSILIVGVLAALSEELFFRGALQRILQGNGAKAHMAIWTAAVIFSAFHLQFYGFFPRLLLGAFFGYLLWWSGSLWLPVTVHAFNNIIVVTSDWHARRYATDNISESLGNSSIAVILLSVVLTAAALVTLRRVCLSQKSGQQGQD